MWWKRPRHGTPPPRPQKEGTAGTPAPRLLLAGLADAYGTTMGVARHTDLVAHEDQLLVAVEAGRVVRGGSVSVRLAGGRRHRPQRWCGGCPLCFECVSDFSRRTRASVGCRRRVTTQRPRCAKTQKRVLRRQSWRATASTDDGSPGRALDPINPRSAGARRSWSSRFAGGRPGVSDRVAALKCSSTLEGSDTPAASRAHKKVSQTTN